MEGVVVMWMRLWQSGVALVVWKWLGLVGVGLLNGHEGEVVMRERWRGLAEVGARVGFK